MIAGYSKKKFLLQVLLTRRRTIGLNVLPAVTTRNATKKKFKQQRIL